MNYRTTLLAAGLLGSTGVGLGAFGAHSLRDFLLEHGKTISWETAARYQLLHAVALFAVAVWLRTSQAVVPRPLNWAAACWTAGTVIFSGSLYVLALGGPRWVGPVTPFGGVLLVAGWLCLVVAALRKES